jgi:DNA-directed RNA polymerase specialized sigma subunit
MHGYFITGNLDDVVRVEVVSQTEDRIELTVLGRAIPPPKCVLQTLFNTWMVCNELTQADVAAIFGVNRSTVSRWAKGAIYLPARVSKFIKDSSR